MASNANTRGASAQRGASNSGFRGAGNNHAAARGAFDRILGQCRGLLRSASAEQQGRRHRQPRRAFPNLSHRILGIVSVPRYTRQMWMGFPVTAIAASLIASECVGWAWQV